MNHFLGVADAGDVHALVGDAIALKRAPFGWSHLGAGRTLGLLFMNPSLRTRVSTQKAGRLLGMDVIVMNADKDSWALEFDDDAVMDGATVEHVREGAPVLGSYCDIIGIRSFAGLVDREKDARDEVLTRFASLSGAPVVSLEGATRHPLQSLADLVTIRELVQKPDPKIVLTWAPHARALPQAVANSFAEWTLAAGHDLTIACPEGYELDPAFTAGATVTNDQRDALRGADVVYVKNWSSWSQYGAVLSRDPSWMLTRESLRATNDARVMHCLPVRRNVELGGDVLDSAHAAVIQEAGNRVWSAMAVLKRMLEAMQ